ncbi:hypothetical protein Mnod_5085 [Methylobacterium nodulans ORS 2060]|uniref:Uncharacterized protein n=1 Tax=Methylobacterium nodulans (strain LMG 21967 / CNCM I-2342 / ORS 2060) TaxID=460265 RepID=B8IIQ4_METNO|nr:hypothetical protein Mnod_5085 [Methylobacterium nodulans ORS 2060]
MIRLLLSWLDRRIDARIEAREAAQRAAADARRSARVAEIDAITAAGGRPGTCLETGRIRDLGPRRYSKESNAGPNVSSRKPSASDDTCLITSASCLSRSSEDIR